MRASLVAASNRYLLRRLAAGRGEPPAGPTPLVSIVITTRDGAGYLRRLLQALSDTRYDAFEVVVVDNGSSDETDEVLAEHRPYRITVVRNEDNRSFSEANNQALEVSGGEWVLFLNNDVLPVGRAWLGWMVSSAVGEMRPSAVGALLIHPPRSRPEQALVVQHAGIRFGFRDGHPHPFNIGGVSGLPDRLATVFEVPAATAAALLVPRFALETIGGFPSGYWYGAEDVDLCLQLRRRGPILVEGRSVLVHAESSTQRRQPRDVIDAYRRANWSLFRSRWSLKLRRSVVSDRLTGRGFWSFGEVPRAVSVRGRLSDEACAWLEGGGWSPDAENEPARSAFGLISDPAEVSADWLPPLSVAWACDTEELWAAHPAIGRFDAALVRSPTVGLHVPQLVPEVGPATGLFGALYEPRVRVAPEGEFSNALVEELRSSGVIVSTGPTSESDLWSVDAVLSSVDGGLELRVGDTERLVAGSEPVRETVDRIWLALADLDADCDGRQFVRPGTRSVES